MQQQIEIKRKFFDVIETLGPRSYKVSRKDELFFLKDFKDDKKGFEEFVERTNKFRMCGVKTPEVYLYDKNLHIIVMDYIDGEFISNIISKEELSEDIYKKLFETFFLAKQDKMYLNYEPGNFKWFKDKLFYIPFAYKKFQNNEEFLEGDLRLWFATKELEKYLGLNRLPFDKKRIKNEFLTNKEIALMAIKYYR